MCRLIFVSLLAILSAYVHFSEACNGYKMRLISVENCLDGDLVLKIDKNFTSKLSEDCILTHYGCVTSKGYKTSKIKYSVKRDGMELITGNPDVCNISDEFEKAKLEMFGLPIECPVPAERKCFNGEKKVDITQFQALLSSGTMEIHYEIEHDTGKTCIESRFEIYK